MLEKLSLEPKAARLIEGRQLKNKITLSDPIHNTPEQNIGRQNINNKNLQFEPLLDLLFKPEENNDFLLLALTKKKRKKQKRKLQL